nr:MAG TPA: hypothetical protein [Microviridae sp.]
MAIKELLGVGTSMFGGLFSGIGANKRQDKAIIAYGY